MHEQSISGSQPPAAGVPIRKAGYLPYIDGLRAVAVLSVVAYHLDARWLPGGFTGVDMFFVISGFVVSASVDRLPPLGAAASMFRFYARRLRRIAPALVACLLLTCIASALFIPQGWLNDTSKRTGLMAFVGMSNWILAGTGDDYFSPKVDFNPYTHTWSLGVEEQFYLLFPLMFMAWLRGGRLRWLSMALFAGGLAGSLAHAVRLSDAGGSIAAFYLTTSRFWQLGAGVLLYQFMVLRDEHPTQDRHGDSWSLALRQVGIGLSILALGTSVVFARPAHSPWPDGSWSVVGTLGVLGLVYRNQQGWLGQLLSRPLMVAIGRISYSLYLWHWPILVLFRWTIGLESLAAKLGALVLAFGLAIASYRWVERPLRHAPWLVRMPHWRFVTAAAAVVAACGFTYSRIAAHANAYSLSTVGRHAGDWYPLASKIGAGTCMVEQGRQSAGAAVAWHYARSGCVGATNAPSTPQLFVAGDSHATAYVEMLQRFVLATGQPVTLYAEGGCPLASLHPARERVPACRRYSRQTLADITLKARRGDVVFLPALRLPRLSEQWMPMDERKALEQVFGRRGRAERRKGEFEAVALLRPLAHRGVRIVLEAPTPLLRAPAYRCSDWFNRANAICAPGLTIDRGYLEHYRQPALDALHRIARRLPGASVWDPFPLLCDRATCSAFRDGHPLLFDGDHLTGYSNRLLLPAFSRHVATLPATGHHRHRAAEE